MSIYATQAEIGIKRFGDNNYIEILVQGVPPHITEVDNGYAFLPPPVDPEGETLRAVVFVEPGDEKGTERSHQEYVKPLLTMTGEEYKNIKFCELMDRLNHALDKRYGPRPGMIFLDPDGTRKNLY